MKHISGNDVDKLVEKAIWYMNIGIVPDIKSGEQIIVKFNDGSVGYTNSTLPISYNWSLRNVYAISAYAIFDENLNPVQRGVVRLLSDGEGFFEYKFIIELRNILSFMFNYLTSRKILFTYAVFVTIMYAYSTNI